MLHAAAASGSAATVQLLIDLGAGVHLIDKVKLYSFALRILEHALGWVYCASLGGHRQLT